MDSSYDLKIERIDEVPAAPTTTLGVPSETLEVPAEVGYVSSMLYVIVITDSLVDILTQIKYCVGMYDAHTIAEEGLILKIIAGSTCYGLNTSESDTDTMGICLVPAVTYFGFGQEGSRFEQYDQDPDNDTSVYSLKKFLTLMMKGNPTILNLIFAADAHVIHRTALGTFLRTPLVYQQLIGGDAAANAFLGYMSSQVKLLREHGQEASGKRIKRPELVERYGFDTKYTMHILRLGFQGIDLLTLGRAVMPFTGARQQFLMEVREGKHSLEYCLNEADQMIDTLEGLKADNVLIAEPDRDFASSIVYSAQTDFWNFKQVLVSTMRSLRDQAGL